MNWKHEENIVVCYRAVQVTLHAYQEAMNPGNLQEVLSSLDCVGMKLFKRACRI